MRLIVVFFSLFIGSVYCQLDIKPFIKTSGAFSTYRNNGPSTYDLSLISGVHFNDNISLGLGISNIKNIYSQIDIFILSISPSFRVLKPNRIFSPVIEIDLGTELWSNAKNEFVNSDFEFTSYSPSSFATYGTGQPRYKKGLFFSKLKLLADFKIKSFNISFGPTLNYMCFTFENVKKYYSDYQVVSQYIDERIGFGGELSLMYTFPMKKREVKKIVE